MSDKDKKKGDRTKLGSGLAERAAQHLAGRQSALDARIAAAMGNGPKKAAPKKNKKD